MKSLQILLAFHLLAILHAYEISYGARYDVWTYPIISYPGW